MAKGGAIVAQKQALKTFRGLLQRMKPQVAMALPKHMSPDRMIRMCMSVVQQNPKILDCTQESVLGCIMTSAQLGLYPDNSILGHAYFIPYKNTCTFIAGYKGLINLASRSDKVTSIMGYAVYEGDHFEFEYGLNPKLVHRPSGDPIEERELTHVYGIGRILNEPIAQFVVMTKEEVDKIRARSPAFQRGYGPWLTDYEPMAIKTVIRRLTKYLPLSSELQKAVALDEAADAGLDQGLNAVGQEALEGLSDPDDPDVIDAEGIEELPAEEDDDGKAPLDNLTDEMGESGDVDEFTKVWAKGNDIFGDAEWKKEFAKLKKATGLTMEVGQMSKSQIQTLITAMEKSIEKGG